MEYRLYNITGMLALPSNKSKNRLNLNTGEYRLNIVNPGIEAF